MSKMESLAAIGEQSCIMVNAMKRKKMAINTHRQKLIEFTILTKSAYKNGDDPSIDKAYEDRIFAEHEYRKELTLLRSMVNRFQGEIRQ